MRGNRRTDPSWLPHLSLRAGRTFGVKARALLVLCFLLTSVGLVSLVLLNTHASAHADPTIVEATVPTPEPWGVNFDSGGNTWVADPQCDANVGTWPLCHPTTGNLLEYASQNFNSGSQPLQNIAEPTGYSSPFFLVFDGSGNIWFAEPVTNAIGVYNINTGNWNQWTVPTAKASPFDLVFDQYGHLWFTEVSANKIGEFDLTTHKFKETPTPTANSRPYGIAGPDPTTHAIWFTENNSSVHQIGSFIPTSSGSMTNGIQEYQTNSSSHSGVTPHLITYDNFGNIWWSEGYDGQIGQLVISKASPGTNKGVTEYLVPPASCAPGCSTHISGIAVDSNDTVWFDDSLNGRVGAYVPSGGYFAMFNVDVGDPNQLNAHPHDGLALDGGGNLWFSEEFVNKLGEGIQNGIPQPQPSPTPTSTATPSPTPNPSPSPTASPTPSATPSPSPTPNPNSAPVNKLWYFAEGKVGQGFTEFLTVEDPDPTNACTVNFDYLLVGGSSVSVTQTVNANSRFTESVNSDLNTNSQSSSSKTVSTIVTVMNPSTCGGVVVERPMYFVNFAGVSSGSDVLGATHTSTSFYFADLSTLSAYNTFLTILNPPGGSAATVTATYFVGGSQVGSDTTTVPAGARGTIIPKRLNKRVEAIVTSTQPVVIERPAYFTNYSIGKAQNISGAASVIGAEAPSTEWRFAEGYVGNGYQENLVLANFANAATNATVVLEYDNGSTLTTMFQINAEDQFTIDVNSVTQNQLGTCSPQPCNLTNAVSAEITSSGNIVAEREMFFHYSSSGNGRTLAAVGGTDVTGQAGPATATAYTFAEGFTDTGYDEWLTLQNPTGQAETVSVTLVNAVGTSYTFQVSLNPHSRSTTNIVTVVIQHLFHNGDGYKGYEVSMTLMSNGSGAVFVAERPMYWNTSGTQGGSDIIGYAGG